MCLAFDPHSPSVSQFQLFRPPGTCGSSCWSSLSRRPMLLASPDLNITSRYCAESPHPTLALVCVTRWTLAPQLLDSSLFRRHPSSRVLGLTRASYPRVVSPGSSTGATGGRDDHGWWRHPTTVP